MNRNTEAPERTEAPFCACSFCKRVPVSHLALDVPEPVSGWAAYFEERNITVLPDAAGRPSVARRVLADLLDEQRERAAQQAERPPAEQVPVPAGLPAREGLTAWETLAAAPGYTSLREELGPFPRPDFLEEELAAGRRHEADKRAAVRRAKEKLSGRDGR